MSDGLSDANRGAEAVTSIEMAASKLSAVLEDLTDLAFGLPPLYLAIANQELRRAGVRLVKTRRAPPSSGGDR